MGLGKLSESYQEVLGEGGWGGETIFFLKIYAKKHKYL
jgi:hypothetical protein